MVRNVLQDGTGIDDTGEFLRRVRARSDRVGVELPEIEIRYEHLVVEGYRNRTLPSLINATLNSIESVAGVVFRQTSSKRKKIQILQDCNGIVRPSRIALLLGPPGAGKTTLLRSLAGQLHGNLTTSGKITCRGQPERACAYVSQHDLHHGEMTVRETFDFSCRCLGVGQRPEILAEIRRREKEAGIKPDSDVEEFMTATSDSGATSIMTDYILEMLGLDVCSDTLVGDAMKRGISGGQKKRVTTGEILVGPAKAFFMDEISNGLDSSTTFQIINHIRQMVHTLNLTVVISLLQPPPETYDLFDDVIVLSEGRLVYQGPREHALEFFNHLGFHCPERKAVADFLQEVTSEKDQQQYYHGEYESYRFVSTSDFAKAFSSFHVGRKLTEELSSPYEEPRALLKGKYGVSNWELLHACFAREWLLMKRNSFVYVFKTVQMTITGFVAFTVFFRTEMAVGEITDGGKFFGALYFSLSNIMFNGMAEISMTVSRLPVFYRQRDFLFYPAWAFCLPFLIMRIPFSVLESTIWIVLTYYTMGFAPAAGRFFRQFLTLIGIHQMALSLFRFIGAVGRTQVVATTLGTFTVLVICIFGGFIVAKDDLPPWLKWGYYVSPMSYGQNAFVMNEFLDERWSSPNTDLRFDQPTVGKVLLQSRGFYTDDYWFWICVAALIGFSILFNLLFVAALTYLNPLGGSNNVATYVDEDDSKKKNKQCTEADNFPKKGMDLPFQPLSLAFNHVNYYVDIPMKPKGAGSDRLQILCDVSGAFTPGVLTALVGVSGAGKTTLLDVLSGRKTGGYIEGNITISGHPKKQDTFARISGYCEQTDIHSAHVTVYESVLYSAWLRLPAEVDKETRKKFVDEVMETVELNPIRNSLVDGLSTEQRKRLTIAVELVANPSILFMDEPTSGLDARAAAIVMRAVNSTVDTGRTVVCTIHQPSIDIFEAFDELLLMKSGGRVIYSGPLGQYSQKLVEYFEAIPGVPKIENGCNPATWMLDITTPASEAKLGVDFAYIYTHSSLYQRSQELVKELSTVKPGSNDLNYPTKYSQPLLSQFQACFWKQYWSYWRHTQYNTIRFFMTIVIAAVFGVVFWNKGQKAEKQQDLQNLLGATYTAVIILGPTNSNSVQAHISKEQRVFYRERASGMYSPLPYAVAQVAVETMYIAVQAAMFSLVLYPMIGFEWRIGKFFWFYYYMFTCFVYFAAYGMMLVALTPDLQTAAITAASSRNLWNLFSGFLIPRMEIPIWWRWFYWCSPVAWTIYGLVTSQLGDSSHQVEIPGVGDMTVEAYLKENLGFEHHFLPTVALMHLGFIFLFLIIFAFGVKFLNFQKR